MKTKQISDKEFEKQFSAAEKRGRESAGYEPRAVAAEYKDGEIFIQTNSGWSFSFKPEMLEELQQAKPAHLKDIKILGDGSTLEWTVLDVHIGIGALCVQLLGEKFLKSEMARRTGSVKSVRKSDAAKANGRLGGRPRKTIIESGSV
jgi:Protein of unknown function (DUF2442)